MVTFSPPVNALELGLLTRGSLREVSAEWAARRGSERAAAVAERQAEARMHRAHIAGALWDSQVAFLTVDGEGREQVDAVEIKPGTLVLVEGRMLRADWLADPAKLARSLASCGKHAGVHQTRDGKWGEHGLGCGTPQCPWCASGRAQSAQDKYKPQALKLLETGDYVAVNATLTQRVAYLDPDQPVVSGRFENEGHGYSVQGARLGAELDRWSASFTALRDNRGADGRAIWDAVVAGVAGVEWTGVDPRGRRRWHVHGHVLLIVRREELGEFSVDAAGNMSSPWVDALRARWCQVSDAEPTGVHVALVATSGQQVDKVERALREVLKYPYKPASLTPAQLCEALAAAKGRKMARPLGWWAPQCRVAYNVRELARAISQTPAGELAAAEVELYHQVPGERWNPWAQKYDPVWEQHTRRFDQADRDQVALAEARLQTQEPKAFQVYRLAKRVSLGTVEFGGGIIGTSHTDPATGRQVMPYRAGLQDEYPMDLVGEVMGSETRLVHVREVWEQRIGHRDDANGARWVPLLVQDLVGEGADPGPLVVLRDGELCDLEHIGAGELLAALGDWSER